MILNPRLHLLSIFTALLAVLLLLHTIPLHLNQRQGDATVFRFLSLAFLVGLVTHFVSLSFQIYHMKNYPVGRGKNQVVTYREDLLNRSLLFSQTLDWIERNLERDQTLLVLPEGEMLNFQTKRLNPAFYGIFNLFEFELYGEEFILNNFKSANPDYIVLTITNMRSPDLKKGFWEEGNWYGRKVCQWIGQNYSIVNRLKAPQKTFIPLDFKEIVFLKRHISDPARRSP